MQYESTSPAVDYKRVKDAALQQLARGGDQAAVAELGRRGVPREIAAIDVTALTDEDLQRLVRAWRDGVFPEDRAESLNIAKRAYAEIEVRHRVEARLLQERGKPAPPPPAIGPWLIPASPRCVGWERPAGSTLYPSELDHARAALAELAAQVYRNHRTTNV